MFEKKKEVRRHLKEQDKKVTKLILRLVKAMNLLETMNANSNSITFNSNGVLIIDGQSIPNSNIFILLPEVFKASRNLKLPGFIEFCSELIDLGLGDLLNKKNISFIRAKSAENDLHTELYKYIRKSADGW